MSIYMIEEQNTHHDGHRFRLFNIMNYDVTVAEADDITTMLDWYIIYDSDSDSVHYLSKVDRVQWLEPDDVYGWYDLYLTDTGIWFYVIERDSTHEIIQSSYRGAKTGVIRKIHGYIRLLAGNG